MTTELGTSEPAAVSNDTPGARLKAARGAINWSIQQAAEHLHLDPWMIEAMEADRFQALGAPVYARGHLRKYAVALGLPPEVLLARYEGLSERPADPNPKPRPAITERKPVKIPVGAVAGAIGVVVVVAGLWWWHSRPASVTKPVSVEAPPAVVKPEPAPAAGVAAPVSVDPPVVKPSAAKPTAVVPPATSAPTPATAPATISAPVRLRLSFSEPSWIEIEDARGRRLLFDTGQPGEPKTVSGEAPLKVMFGYASAVTLRVNDRPVVVPKRSGVDSARFVVEADGTIKRE